MNPIGKNAIAPKSVTNYTRQDWQQLKGGNEYSNREQKNNSWIFNKLRRLSAFSQWGVGSRFAPRV